MEPSRIDKVNKEIKKAISEIIQFEARDERLKTFSISEVEVSRDLHFARVKVIERDNREAELIQYLNKARVFIRKLLAERLNFLKYIPELVFEYDAKQEKVAEVYKLMAQVEEERAERAKVQEEQKKESLLKKIYQKITQASNILVLTHLTPDGDALGAVAAIGHFLQNRQQKYQIFLKPNLPEQFNYLFEGLNWSDKEEELEKDYDLVILLDVGDLKRTGLDWDFSSYEVVNIDHHVSNVLEIEEKWVDPTASSTGELVFKFFQSNGVEITPSMAEAMYLAIYTDTGRFSYENTTPESLAISAELLELGAKPYRIYRAAYESKTIEEILLSAEVLSKAQFDSQFKIAWTVMDKEIEKKYKYDPFALKEIVGELRSIKDAEVAIFFKELEKGKYKLSFRSKGLVDVNKLANVFGGGGHQRASGAVVEDSVESIMEKVKRELLSGNYRLFPSDR